MFEKIDKYFLKYNNLSKKIITKELELEQLEETYTSVGSLSYNEKTSGTKKQNGIDDKLVRIESLREYLNKLYSKRDNLKEKHILDFKKLSKSDYEIILTGFYLDKVSLKGISSKLDKSIGHIKKLKRAAMKELLELNKKNT